MEEVKTKLLEHYAANPETRIPPNTQFNNYRVLYEIVEGKRVDTVGSNANATVVFSVLFV